MNYTIDMVNSFAEKLTYRIMVMAGVSQENLDKYLKAVIEKEKGISNADEKLDVPITVFGITFANVGKAIQTGLVIIVVVVGIILYRRYKK